MKTERNILIAFLLNALFSVFELIGGMFIGSIAVVSDAVHDFGDAISLGISFFLEKKSKKQPDETYTYGYVRYSVLGAALTNIILIAGSAIVITGGIQRLFNPVEIRHNEMIIFAIIGVIVNLGASYFTIGRHSLNERAVNLHMLEDVLGWAIVLIGAVIIKFTGFNRIDPIMSIIVAVFILVNAFKGIKAVLDLILVKIPDGIEINELKEHLIEINGVEDVHHIHIWSLDGTNNYATLHVVTSASDTAALKAEIKEELREHSIGHVTVEIEDLEHRCEETECHVEAAEGGHHHQH